MTPIETMMLDALRAMAPLPIRIIEPGRPPAEPGNRCTLENEANVLGGPPHGYRVDFLLCGRGPQAALAAIVVECDGHAWHERTPEQGGRDRTMDRRLQQAGYIILRFTGTQINRDRMACGKQVWDIMMARTGA